jgi:hypothetical protein
MLTTVYIKYKFVYSVPTVGFPDMLFHFFCGGLAENDFTYYGTSQSKMKMRGKNTFFCFINPTKKQFTSDPVKVWT